MRLDGARSATRKEQEGETCATRVTRGTIDFQARDSLELRDEEGARACCKDESFGTRNLRVPSSHLSGAERWPTTPLPPNNYHPPSLVNVH